MSPRNIVARVLSSAVDVVAICDHNSAENVPAVMKAAEGARMTVLPGMEVCTKEEIHVLAVFESMTAASQMQSLVYSHLQGMNNPDVFGWQVIANELDEVEGFQEKLLIGATDLSLEEVVNRTHDWNGLAIASHIDRESYSVIGQLGFIPETVQFDALEISSRMRYEEAREQFAQYSECAFIRNSDAHFINDIGSSATEFLVESPTFGEISKALHHVGGRMVRVH